MTEQKMHESIDYDCKYGILFHVESLLSCFSDELDMMIQHYCAIKSLNNVYIHFPKHNVNTQQNSSISVKLES